VTNVPLEHESSNEIIVHATKLIQFSLNHYVSLRKVFEQNGKTEILSLLGVILLFRPHFPVFPFCFGYYFM